MASPIPPTLSGGPSGGGSSGAGDYAKDLQDLIQGVSLKVSSGTLNLTGLRAWTRLDQQVKLGTSETGTLALNTNFQTLQDLLHGSGGMAKADPVIRGVSGYGPIVMPFEADEVTMKVLLPGTVNDVFTTPFRSLGYGDLFSVGRVPANFPRVKVPLWVYAFNFPTSATVNIMLRNYLGRTSYEATVTTVTGNHTVGSLAGTSNLAGAVECHIYCDQDFYWNYGGKWDATIVTTPTGARQMTAQTESLFGEVVWPEG